MINNKPYCFSFPVLSCLALPSLSTLMDYKQHSVPPSNPSSNISLTSIHFHHPPPPPPPLLPFLYPSSPFLTPSLYHPPFASPLSLQYPFTHTTSFLLSLLYSPPHLSFPSDPPPAPTLPRPSWGEGREGGSSLRRNPNFTTMIYEAAEKLMNELMRSE